VKSIKPKFFWIGPILLLAIPMWSQQPAGTQPDTQTGNQAGTQDPTSIPVGNVANAADSGPAADARNTGEDRMLTPPPVSGQSYPTASASQERSNYLRAGVSFTSAYSDNAVGPVDGHPESDISYSVAPTLALDQTTTRLHWVMTYAPGFTFYQRFTERNEADQNASVSFQYRVSPHVTFNATDGFQKSSNVFNQPDLAAGGGVTGGGITGGTQGGNFSVIAPVASRLSNGGNVGLTYQFAANSMVGASGSFSNLHYPDQAEVPGLFDSESQGGSAFYSVRVSKLHYFGASYQYQRLLSFPEAETNEAQTHALLLFYTLYLSSRFSISVFGGPQYADVGPQYSASGSTPLAGFRSWKPEAGGSLSWQGNLTNVAVSYAHTVASGGGLIGAVQSDSASASIGQQLSKRLTATVTGAYAQNNILNAIPQMADNGHTVSGTAGLQRQIGQRLNVQLGYTRLHQDYSSVTVLAATPDTNREFISVSYQFSRPLGR
jgi:hypothetical protein